MRCFSSSCLFLMPLILICSMMIFVSLLVVFCVGVLVIVLSEWGAGVSWRGGYLWCLMW